MKLSERALTAAAASVLVAVAGAAATAASRQPKVTPAQAKAAAVHKISGTALSAKYEYEDSRWQYAVLVKHGAALYEVEVSATTGKVLDTEITSAAEERNEAVADAKAARHPK